MILSVHQPNYWPYPGLIGKIMKSDRFVYLTKVQFEKNSWQVRNRIRTKDGWSYIGVPVITKGRFPQNICDVEINNKSNWREKELRAISMLYGKAPFFKEYKDFLEDLYLKKWEKLLDVDIYIMNFILQELNCNTEIFFDMDYTFIGNKTDLLVDMCKKLECDLYLSNLGSSAYIQIEQFTKQNINHRYINYLGCEYSQRYDNFENGLSILDMLMNCGRQLTRQIILDDSNYEYSEINQDMKRGE